MPVMVSLVRIFRNDSFSGIFDDKYQLYRTIKLINSFRTFMSMKISRCFLYGYLSMSGVRHLFPVPFHTFSVIPIVAKETHFVISGPDRRMDIQERLQTI